MRWLKESLSGRVAAVALMTLLAGWGTAGGAQDQFSVELGRGGDLVRGSGAGFNHGSWYYYSGSDWWTQWFFNGAVDPTKKKVVEVDLTVTVLKHAQPFSGGGELVEADVDR